MSELPEVESRPFPVSGIVRLNIGGENFMTNVGTLAGKCDYFSSLCSEGEKPLAFLPDAHGGAFFIDRSAHLFHHVLDYLRSGIVPKGLSSTESAFLRAEAAFYGCKPLAEALAAPHKVEYKMAATAPAGGEARCSCITDRYLNGQVVEGWRVQQLFEGLSCVCSVCRERFVFASDAKHHVPIACPNGCGTEHSSHASALVALMVRDT